MDRGRVKGESKGEGLLLVLPRWHVIKMSEPASIVFRLQKPPALQGSCDPSIGHKLSETRLKVSDIIRSDY